MDFQAEKKQAIAKMALMLYKVDERLKDAFPVNAIICNAGMREIDHLDDSETIIEYNERLPAVIEFFQTNLNNEFPFHNDVLNHFISRGMDLGENNRKEVYREMMLKRLQERKANQ